MTFCCQNLTTETPSLHLISLTLQYTTPVFFCVPPLDMRTAFNCLHTVGLYRDHRILVYTIHQRNKGRERETNNIGFLEVEITFFLHTFDPTHCTLAEGLQTWLSFLWAIWNFPFCRSMWLHSTAFIYAMYIVHGDNPRPSLKQKLNDKIQSHCLHIIE